LGDIFSPYIPCFEYNLVSLRDYSFASLAGKADPLSFGLVMDKVRDGGGGSLLEELPEKYVERLQIPENMRKLISDVTRVLLDARGITRGQIETIISQFDKGEYQGMFEGIREAFEKSYRRGYRQARTRYEERHQRDQEQLRQRDERLRQRDEQFRQYQERIRLLEEENRRLRGE
jgi:phenylpyruvate tautomerase PptA (4-oxalocrotonate tautomerase family)